MNGIHDMGGMDGFGPVEREENEPVFHHRWEGRVYALTRAVKRWGVGRNWPGFRFVLESIPPRRIPENVLLRALVSHDGDPAGRKRAGEWDRAGDWPSGSQCAKARAAAAPRFRIARLRPPRPGSPRPISPERHGARPQSARVRAHASTALRAGKGGDGRGGLRRVCAAGQRRNRHAAMRPSPSTSTRFASRHGSCGGERAAAGDAVYVDLWEEYLEAV